MADLNSKIQKSQSEILRFDTSPPYTYGPHQADNCGHTSCSKDTHNVPLSIITRYKYRTVQRSSLNEILYEIRTERLLVGRGNDGRGYKYNWVQTRTLIFCYEEEIKLHTELESLHKTRRQIIYKNINQGYNGLCNVIWNDVQKYILIM